MLENLFSFEGCDYQDDLAISYYDCVLRKDIGEFVAGTLISTIFINYDACSMEFFVDKGESYELVATFNISMTLTRKED